MAQLTLKQLAEVVATYVDKNKMASTDFTATKDNIVGLLDKIGKIATINDGFVDKLDIFDGEDLPFGKTIEEYFMDLILPTDGANPGTNDTDVAKYYAPTHRPVAYSKTLGKKTFALSIPYNNIERAVNNAAQMAAVTSQTYGRLSQSENVWRYAAKRQMIADLIEKENDAFTNAKPINFTDTFEEGTFISNGNNKSLGNVGVVVKKLVPSGGNNWADKVADGSIIVLDTHTTITIPTDTATGEAFIKQIKKDVEKASDISEGYSFNGNTIGATNKDLWLIIKQGIIPSLEVDTQAGAYHLDKIAIPANTRVVKDFGTDTSAYAVLADVRGIKLHSTYRAVRDFLNGRNDFITYFMHTENTAYLSRNTFVKIYKSE